jgi:hypothetical protein
MNKILAGIFIAVASVTHAQDLSVLIHFNNADDELQMRDAVTGMISTDDFTTVVGGSVNPDTKIQFIFYDPTVSGVLETVEAPANDPVAFVQKWQEAHADESRVLFLFSKGDAGYGFTALVTTLLVANGQLPEIVRSWIVQHIIEPEASNYQAALSEGFKAIVNAYDHQFIDRLQDEGTQMLSEPKYLKGYCYVPSLPYNSPFEISHLGSYVHYRFRLQEEYITWSEELPVEFLTAGTSTAAYITQPFYYNGPFNRMRTSDFAQLNSLLFGYSEKGIFNAAGAKHIRLNSLNPSGSFNALPIEELYYYNDRGFETKMNAPSVNAEYLKIIDSRTGQPTELSALKREFDAYSAAAYQKLQTKVNQVLQNPNHLDAPHTRYSFCRSTMSIQRVPSGSRMPQPVLDLFYGGKAPTWCNTYARDLMEETFEMEVLPWVNADSLYNLFLADDGSQFVSLEGMQEEDINSLINSGYVVIFSYNGSAAKEPGHIELGYPNEELMTIGAGASVAKKLWSNDSFGSQTRRNVTRKYLYLGYLFAEHER